MTNSVNSLPEFHIKVKVTSDSLRPHGPHSPWNSPGQNTRGGSCSLLQGVFPTQGSNQGLLHCRQILYQLNHQGSPRKLEWVANPLFSISSWPRNWTRVFCTAGEFLAELLFSRIPYQKVIGKNLTYRYFLSSLTGITYLSLYLYPSQNV